VSLGLGSGAVAVAATQTWNIEHIKLNQVLSKSHAF